MKRPRLQNIEIEIPWVIGNQRVIGLPGEKILVFPLDLTGKLIIIQVEDLYRAKIFRPYKRWNFSALFASAVESESRKNLSL